MKSRRAFFSVLDALTPRCAAAVAVGIIFVMTALLCFSAIFSSSALRTDQKKLEPFSSSSSLDALCWKGDVLLAAGADEVYSGCRASLKHRLVDLDQHRRQSAAAAPSSNLPIRVIGLMGDTVNYERANVAFFSLVPQSEWEYRCTRIDLQSHQAADRGFIEDAYKRCVAVATISSSSSRGHLRHRSGSGPSTAVGDMKQPLDISATLSIASGSNTSLLLDVYLFYAASKLSARSVEALAEVWGYMLTLYPPYPTAGCGRSGGDGAVRGALAVPDFASAGYLFMEEYAGMLMEAFPHLMYFRVPLHTVFEMGLEYFPRHRYLYFTPHFGVSPCQEVTRWQWYEASQRAVAANLHHRSGAHHHPPRSTQSTTGSTTMCVAMIKHNRTVGHSTNRFFNLTEGFLSELADLGVTLIPEDTSKRSKLNVVNTATVLIDSSGATNMINRMLLGGSANLRMWITFVHPDAEDIYASKCPSGKSILGSSESFFLFPSLNKAAEQGSGGSREHYYYCRHASARLTQVPQEVADAVRRFGCTRGRDGAV